MRSRSSSAARLEQIVFDVIPAIGAHRVEAVAVVKKPHLMADPLVWVPADLATARSPDHQAGGLDRFTHDRTHLRSLRSRFRMGP